MWGLPCPAHRWTGGELLPRHFTLTVTGGIFSVALSVVSRRPGVTRHTVLWSSDFPRALTRGRSPFFRRKYNTEKMCSVFSFQCSERIEKRKSPSRNPSKLKIFEIRRRRSRNRHQTHRDKIEWKTRLSPNGERPGNVNSLSFPTPTPTPTPTCRRGRSGREEMEREKNLTQGHQDTKVR